MKRLSFTATLLLTAFSAFAARTEFKLEKGWRFTREDHAEAVRPDFDDSAWQRVTVPHDWAIYGPFDIGNDPQFVAIEQDGETVPSLKAGRTGGLPVVGPGWYRIRFDVPDFAAGKRADILFDGAMSNARVYLNGEEIGYWPYGYGSFQLDATRLLKPEDNVLAVRLENYPESSRWYPGAGLYRNVHVIVSDEIRIPLWGIRLTTPEIRPDHAKVRLQADVESPAGVDSRLVLKTLLRDAGGRVVAKAETTLAEYDAGTFCQDLMIDSPRLWSPDTPDLYEAELRLYADGELRDTRSVPFGVRELKIVPDRGMFLNGEPIKFRGVCLHHDLGPLGAAVNVSALRRQLSILKEMGANAVRTAHNIPAPELVELCDRMGLMVMVETFDEWRTPKMKNGYHLYFDEWAERDLVNTVRRFRNHPSVVMWCIGNEVPDQSSYEGAKIARWLQDICHREDPTRLVTMGIDRVQDAIDTHFAAVMDVVGFNYRTHLYTKAYHELPQQIMMGSETASTFSSRGTYHFPVERTVNKVRPDNQSSGYDLDCGSWSNLPEDDFVLHDDYDWCIGEFVWTGFDYLGEPTPYHEIWPNHSSLFGIVDLAGLPKDRYYLYRSHWRPEEETLHVLPHWTWPGREGEVTPVFVYTNYPSAELFVNGRSQGRIAKDTTMTQAATDSEEAARGLWRQRRYRLMWMDVKYEPGTLRVVAYDRNGRPAAETEVHTAGEPCRLELSADRQTLRADGKDLSFVTVRVVDRAGNLCPDAAPEVSFRVTGAGGFRAAANGDPTCLEPFHHPRMKAFKGQLVAIVRSGEKPGKIGFEASAEGLRKARLEISVK